MVNDVATKTGDLIYKVQKAWREFAEADANLRAGDHPRGTICPVLYHSALSTLGVDRLQQLKRSFEQEYWGDE